MNYSQAQDGRTRSEPGRGGGSWRRGAPRDQPGCGAARAGTALKLLGGSVRVPGGEPQPGTPRCLLQEGGWHQGWLLEGGGGQAKGAPARQGVVGRSSISHPGPESTRGDSNKAMSPVPCTGGTPRLRCPAPWVSQRMLSRHSSRTSPLCLQDTPGGGFGGWNLTEHTCSTRGSRTSNHNYKK